MQISQKLSHMTVREVVKYKHDDMMAYVSITAFVAMATIFLLILSL